MAEKSYFHDERRRLTTSRQLMIGVLLGCAWLVASATPSLAGGTGDFLVVSESFWGAKNGKPCRAKKIPDQQVFLYLTPEQLEQGVALAGDIFGSASADSFQPADLNYTLDIERVEPLCVPENDCDSEKQLLRQEGRLENGQTNFSAAFHCNCDHCTGADVCGPLFKSKGNAGPALISVTVNWKKKKKAAGTGLRVQVASAS